MKRQHRPVEAVQRASAALLGLVVLAIGAISCSKPQPPIGSVHSSDPARYLELRRLVARNFHYNLECWCVTADPATVIAVNQAVGEVDIPVLLDLLGDQDDRVASVASSVLERFGDKALLPLRHLLKTIPDRDLALTDKPFPGKRFWVEQSIMSVESYKRRHVPTSAPTK